MPLTSLSMRADTWMDGVAAAGQDLRLEQVGAFLTGASPSGSTGIAARPGVRYGTGDPLKISASSGMTLAVNAGIAWVQGSAAANSGMYTGCLDTAGTVTLATSDPTNPRIDNIIVQVIDNGDATSTTKVTPQTGTPASSPVAPTLPANSLLLAQVAVAASTSSIVAGNITDKRVWTVSVGGIVPMANVTGGISGPAGLYGQDLSTGRLKVADGAGNARQPKVAAFAPASASATFFASINSNTTKQSIMSASVTVDGVTELEVTFTWQSLASSSGVQSVLDVVFLDFSTTGTGSSATWGPVNGNFQLNNTSVKVFTGGMIRSWITPAAGTVTIYVLGQLAQSGGYYNVEYPYLRVQANVQQ